MREIRLTQGLVTLVDDSDFDYLNQWKWYANKGGKTMYAIRTERQPNGKRIGIKMHRMILGITDSSVFVDHIDGDGLNNQRCNIRKCTRKENTRNCCISQRNKLGVKGVYLIKDNRIKGVYKTKESRPFKVIITANRKQIFIGYFKSLEEAKQARIDAEKKYFGQFARQVIDQQ